ncbi:hypothetical protein CDD82_4132 [Ophiocordyceps australis]|uniref:GPI anchored serine-rich protein n=1 Tax=Ophiocordyceps australis TaxID=1399860 RepID=A0A2C5XLD4_9HYPO|nr:hypothetical protein CDD82_4132 [Ophiocordyceps australis]
MAGSALASDAAVSTDYQTHLITITACPPSVTNCPARSMTSSVITSVVSQPASTAYSTKVHTITSCAPDVTNCPAHSTVRSTQTYPVSMPTKPAGPPTSNLYPSPSNNKTNVAPSVVPSGPVGGNPPEASEPAETEPVETEPAETEPAETEPVETETSEPTETEAPVCQSSTVTAITKSYTTVLTSVEYSTIEAPCATGVPPQGPSGTVTVPAVTPPVSTQALPRPGGNNTITLTGGASSMAGSAMLAAGAGLVAVMLA